MSTFGRPTRYDPAYCQLAHNYCLLGATNERLGEFFGVTSRTIDNWIASHPEFEDAVQRGRNIADATVAESLYRRAVGYEHEVEAVVVCGGKPKIVKYRKCYPPDTAAGKHWLRNRRPQNWGGRVRPGRQERKEQEALTVPTPVDDHSAMPAPPEPEIEAAASTPCRADGQASSVPLAGRGNQLRDFASVFVLGDFVRGASDVLATDLAVADIAGRSLRHESFEQG